MSSLWQGFVTAIALLRSGDAETLYAVWTTLRVSGLSIVGSLILGVPMGFVLGAFDFWGKSSLRLLMHTLLSFPTVLIGLLVYLLLSRQGPLGDLHLLFTLPGVALGQLLLGLPIVVALTDATIAAQDRRLKETLLSLGASSRQILLSSIWEARYGLLAVAMTAYGRIVSEVGISMMVGGNIKWSTRTITTAIALETGKGKFAMGIALGLVLLSIALVINICLVFLGRNSIGGVK